MDKMKQIPIYYTGHIFAIFLFRILTSKSLDMVLKQIRISKSTNTTRSYVLSMYSNKSNNTVCQICKVSTEYVDVTEIANYGIELPLLKLISLK